MNTTKVSVLKKNKYNFFNILKMHPQKIADKDGKLKEGLVYGKDFVVLSPILFNLFQKWYGSSNDLVLKRHKIILEEEKDMSNIDLDKGHLAKFPNGESQKLSFTSTNINSWNMTQKQLSKNHSFLKGEDPNTEQKFEIEIFPVYLLFFNFLDLIKKNFTEMNQIKSNLDVIISKENVKYYQFSRKTKFTDILKTLQNTLKTFLTEDNSRLWVYYQNRLEICPFNESL